MGKPIVSILIPTYNHEKYVGQTLKSILEQTYSDIELIILNDGSTDQTHGKIKEIEGELRKRFKKYIYIYKENEGICKTLNKALALSTGRYIIPFSSDDIMLKNRVEKQVEYMEKHKYYGMVYTDMHFIYNDGWIDVEKSYSKEMRISQHMTFQEGNIFEFLMLNVVKLPTPTVCIRRECYETLGGYDESLVSEDIDMFLRIGKGYGIGCIKEVLTLHRIHGSNFGKNFQASQKIIDQIIRKYSKGAFLTEAQKKLLFNTLQRCALYK